MEKIPALSGLERRTARSAGQRLKYRATGAPEWHISRLAVNPGFPRQLSIPCCVKPPIQKCHHAFVVREGSEYYNNIPMHVCTVDKNISSTKMHFDLCF